MSDMLVSNLIEKCTSLTLILHRANMIVHMEVTFWKYNNIVQGNRMFSRKLLFPDSDQWFRKGFSVYPCDINVLQLSSRLSINVTENYQTACDIVRRCCSVARQGIRRQIIVYPKHTGFYVRSRPN